MQTLTQDTPKKELIPFVFMKIVSVCLLGLELKLFVACIVMFQSIQCHFPAEITQIGLQLVGFRQESGSF